MCKMPLPFALAPAGGAVANWRVGVSIHSCAGCESLMARIVEKLSKSYDLRDLTRDLSAGFERRSRPRIAAHPPCSRARPGQ